ncbi:hypothetical protein [Zooshikella ganghwensis]|uniref:hypothetical protein n=1 Tax=Zooshikella ganghwensis TaxID=202772 RepID=UPI000417B0FD|nr:hypothetical protein [Zooshikella ganghwensis]
MRDCELNFRIVDDTNYLSTLAVDELNRQGDPEGFFEIKGDSFTYGYYHNNPLYDGEEGECLIAIWLEFLCKMLINILSSHHIAIKDIEKTDSWLGFELTGKSSLSINILKGGENISKPMILGYSQDLVKKDDLYLTVSLNSFFRAVVDAINKYLKTLLIINSNYSKTQRYNYLKKLNEEVIQTYNA